MHANPWRASHCHNYHCHTCRVFFASIYDEAALSIIVIAFLSFPLPVGPTMPLLSLHACHSDCQCSRHCLILLLHSCLFHFHFGNLCHYYHCHSHFHCVRHCHYHHCIVFFSIATSINVIFDFPIATWTVITITIIALFSFSFPLLPSLSLLPPKFKKKHFRSLET